MKITNLIKNKRDEEKCMVICLECEIGFIQYISDKITNLIEGLEIKSIEQIYDEMIEAYCQGDYLDGCTPYGEDALMGPDKFGERFHNICLGFGYREAEIIPLKLEIIDWCREHLLHLESKFR